MLDKTLLSFYSLFAVLGMTYASKGGLWYWLCLIALVWLVVAIPVCLYRQRSTLTRWGKISLVGWEILDLACLVITALEYLGHTIKL